MPAFAPEHELLGVGAGHLEEIEARVHLRADPFKRHDGSNYVSEARGDLERELINDIREVKHQLLELDLPDFKTEIPVEQHLYCGAESGFFFGRELDEAHPDHIAHEAVNVTLDDVEEGIYKLRL